MGRGPRVLALLGVLLAVAAFVGACDGSMTYAVTSDAGYITCDVEDSRSGKHTVWIVLLDPPAGQHRELVIAMHDGGVWLFGGESGHGSGSPVPSGAYDYEVYDCEGFQHEGRVALETPDHLVGTGTVNVP
jgi:hypothetical protein